MKPTHGDDEPDAGNGADERTRLVLPIAAIGASAGGLAPTIELLREVGADPGMAIVVIHHLDPSHESGLVEILSRSTPMPVAAAEDGAVVVRNHVYVVPPNAGLLIEHGVLRLVPRLEVAGLHLPIDRFFDSLARDREGLAVGVVLSGSGFDGTAGIKAIKREGGVALAQDSTAQYGSMPQSAIATGYVDFILPPAGLAQELRRIGANGPALAAAPTKPTAERDYLGVLAAVRRVTGVDFTNYKQTTILRRLQRRLFLSGLTDLASYVDLLKHDPMEVRALCEEVLIHVSGFFREPETFEALRRYVLPKICGERTRDDPIRVWVPGCSTGEEVYSIAICLLEFLEDGSKTFPIKIFGTDLSSSIVEKARAGAYTESIERDVSRIRLERFFAKTATGYQIRRDVRDLCVFARHDVTRDPPFSAMDLVSCRNVMIYLGPSLQDRVIALLHFALKQQGFLALGSAETVRAFAGFSAVDSKNKIYAPAAGAPGLAFDFTLPRLPFDPSPSHANVSGFLEGFIATKAAGSSDIQREADRLVLRAFGPPGVVVTHDLVIVEFRGHTGPFFEHAAGAASLNLLRAAREELRVPLRRAIDKARSMKGSAHESGISLLVGDRRRTLTLRVIPFAVRSAEQRFFLVLFDDVTPQEPAAEVSKIAPETNEANAVESTRQELVATRQYLESVIEQGEATNEELKAATEEIVSNNEELRSTNEELQSAKEELQATNEELRTVNDEMRERNIEATRLSDDLANVLNSVEIPILISTRDTRLRKYTPAAGRLFGLGGSDIGRRLSEIPQIVAIAPELVRRVPEVLEQLRPVECTVRDAGGHGYHFAARPYVALDGRIDGTVIAARDVDAEMKSAERLAAAWKYSEDIVNSVRDALVVLGHDLRVRTVNSAFVRAFDRAPKDLEGRRLDELGHSELAAPALQKLLTDLRDGRTAEGVRLEQTNEPGAARVFVLHGRPIEGTDLLLLAIDDVTEAERGKAAAQRAELGLRHILTAAAEGILMVDPGGRILFVNRAGADLFSYTSEELTGLSVDLLLPERFRGAHVHHRAAYMSATATRSMGGDRVLVGRRKDGTEFPIEVVLSTLGREEGPVVVAFITDVTVHAYQDRLQRMVFDAALTEERERRRMAIELHDRIGQTLALAQIKLTFLRGNLPNMTRAAVDEAIDLLEQAIADKRALVFELSPPVLYDLGLNEALAWFAENVEKRFGMTLEVIDDGVDKPLNDAAKAIAFRTIRELVMNVFKHAQTKLATISLRRADDRVFIIVEDSGVGFDPHVHADRDRAGGFGLMSIREQIIGLGGELKIESAPERGTRVTLHVPLNESPTTLEHGREPAGDGEGRP
jgi:two-component system CheB/CheR fusion protein